jgi:hypothetical protein
MSNSDFLTFRNFSDQQFAKEFCVLLEEHQIEHILESSGSINSLAQANDAQYYVKIKGKDFNTAHQALRAFYAKQAEQVESDYYLLSFTQEELLDLIHHPDEWSDFDYALATKLLKESGIQEIEHTVILPENARQKSEQPVFTTEDLIKGIIGSLAGGFMGIVKGWWVLTDKVTLPNGEQDYAYSESDRKRGGQLFVIGGLLFLIYVIFSIYFIFKSR